MVAGGKRLGEERPSETKVFWLTTGIKSCTVSCRERKPVARGCVKSRTSSPKKSAKVAAGMFQTALANV